MKNQALAARIANGGNGKPNGAPEGLAMERAAPRGMDTATAAHSSAAHMEARIKARTLMALHNPRDMETVFAQLTKECRRPSFAKVAFYSKPIGGSFVDGPSVRFVEAALRIFGNADSDVQVIYEDAEQRIVRVAVVDLETNTGHSTDVVVQKTVERNKVANDREALATRTNSKGGIVYIVRATEDEMLVKTNSLVSKALRTNGLRLIPGDVVDECKRLVHETAADKNAIDPDAKRKAITADFAEFGVNPDDLREFLGHDLNTFTSDELARLHGIYTAISEGETTWHAVMEARRAEQAAAPKTPAKATDRDAGAGEVKAEPSSAVAENQAQDDGPSDAAFERAVRKMLDGCKIPELVAVIHAATGKRPVDKDAATAMVPEALACGWTLPQWRDAVAKARAT